MVAAPFLMGKWFSVPPETRRLDPCKHALGALITQEKRCNSHVLCFEYLKVDTMKDAFGEKVGIDEYLIVLAAFEN